MKILVAEDNRINRMILMQYLRAIPGSQCFEVDDGEKALRIWEAESPEILITDIEMPTMDGISLISEIRARETDTYTYIIVLTVHDDFECLGKSFDAGADDFLPKPFQQRELLYRIHAGERLLSLFQKQFIVYALAHLTEVRDMESGKHIERISAYSKVIATSLRTLPEFSFVINRRFLDNLEIASVLHDIGKVGIDDQILRKNARLSDHEWSIMKTHTLIGQSTIENILSKYPKAQFLKFAAEVARWHHEWFDGSGYPDGLSGRAIPLAARIVALADVYDALINERVYKPAFSFDEARDIIVKESGTHFDPLIVQVFLEQEETFRHIARNYANPINSDASRSN